MRTFYNILGAVVVLVVLASMVVAVSGNFTESDRQTEVTCHLNAPPDSVFAVITDYRRYPEWRKELLHVEMLPARDSIQSWREYDVEKVNCAYEAVEKVTPSYVKIKIAEPTSSVQGSWAFTIIPDGTGSKVKVTVEGTVNSLFYRYIGRIFFKKSATIKSYLTSLASRFGQTLILE